MQKGTFIGINFGTTNTAVVQIFNDEHGIRAVNLGEDGEYPFSSIVAIPKKGGSLKFGREVRMRREEFKSDYEIFSSMKTYLGTDHEFVVGADRYSATEITARFLKSVKTYIKKVHGIEVEEAGLSFPINFTPAARRELCIAAKEAGINIKCFISEPTAAYFANLKAGRAYSRIMVLDWGGGTFDISILNLKKNHIAEVAVFGEKIGGDDIDIDLANRLHVEVAKKSSAGIHIPFDEMDAADRDLMIARAEQAKIELSDTEEEYDLIIMQYGKYGTITRTVSVDLLNGIVEPLVKGRILKAIDSALGRANLTPAGIDAVIIVGGSSNLMAYERAVMRLFGEDKIILPQAPEWSTAKGAALMQIIGGDYKLSDSLGVFLSDRSVLPLFKGFEHGVGSKVGPLGFSQVEDSQSARFIFTNGEGDIVFERVNIPTKGFSNEIINLTAEIGYDQIARIEIANSFMGNLASNLPYKVEINELTFYYDITALD